MAEFEWEAAQASVRLPVVGDDLHASLWYKAAVKAQKCAAICTSRRNHQQDELGRLTTQLWDMVFRRDMTALPTSMASWALRFMDATRVASKMLFKGLAEIANKAAKAAEEKAARAAVKK